MRFDSKSVASFGLSMILLAVSGTIAAQGGKAPYEEYDKLINKRKAIATLGPDMFGDQVDLVSGSLTFTTTDVSLAGNNALPVAVTRKLSVHSDNDFTGGPFGDWDIDLPNINGTFAPDWHDNRCDQPVPPGKTVIGDATAETVAGERYWSGTRASMPGGGDLLRITASSKVPSTGTYKYTTPARTVFSCLPTIKNGPGQGFLAVTADGTRYTFDHMAQEYTAPYTHTWRYFPSGNPYDTNPVAAYTSGTLYRKRNALYVTKVEDRFGNTVTYTYSNQYNQGLVVNSIASNDGRSITFHYNANGLIDSVTSGPAAGGHTWTYQYFQNFFLSGVTQPDGGRWAIDLSAFSFANITYSGTSDPNWRTCFRPGPLDVEGPYVGTITHPSGAKGTFSVAPVIHGRSNVPALCENYISKNAPNNYNDPTNDYAIFPIKWHGISLTSKQITGPGLPTQTWTFDYANTKLSTYFFPDGQTEPYKCDSETCADPVCLSDECAGTSITTVTGPNGEWTRHTYGNSYRYNEGKLLKTEVGTDAAHILSTTTKTYELRQSGQPYATQIGTSTHGFTDGFTSEFPRPEVSSVVTQQGVTFSSTVETGCSTATAYCLDGFLRPTRQRRFSSLGTSKVDTTTYFDQLAKWVLGQVATQATDGIETSRTDYAPTTALPLKNYSFGILRNTLTYNADGTLATVKDGNNRITTLTSWKRGTPQKISYPVPVSTPAVTAEALVDDHGNLAWVKDELGSQTSYTYDAMDRLTKITYPAEGAFAWSDTTTPFVVATAEYGLPAGHWKQTIQTGNGRTTTHYDAQWRPVLVITEDTANSASRSFVVNRYDAGGRLAFASYPVGSLGSVDETLQGIRTEYDALGRPTKVFQDSELGVLTSTTEYLPGFVTRTTNPRGFKTTTSYQVFDRPDTSRPVQIQSPQFVTTQIARDVFGKPLTVTRVGPGG